MNSNIWVILIKQQINDQFNLNINHKYLISVLNLGNQTMLMIPTNTKKVKIIQKIKDNNKNNNNKNNNNKNIKNNNNKNNNNNNNK